MFKRKPVNVEGITVHVYGDKAFVPSKARYETGLTVDKDPVYISDLKAENVVSIIENARMASKEKLPFSANRDQVIRDAAKPILLATGAKSWKELAKSGIAYMLIWTDDIITLAISELDKKGRYEYPKSKERTFSSDTTLIEVVHVILEDVNSRRN
ncbi:MAG: hypothetical protein HUU38_16310 [Anaerolineales bacterium]|nr:hypothetical protein [Anaerolineales bacterium]